MLGKRKVLRFTKDKILQEEKETKRKNDKRQSNENFFEMMSLSSGVGFSISLPIVGGALLGQFLDGKFHSSPRMTLSLIFLGLILGVCNIYNIIKKTG